MPTPTPLPAPAYTPTDIITAIGVVVSFGLDALVGFFPQLQLDATTRVALISSLTVLAVAGTTAVISNRRVKVQAQAQVAIAQANAAPQPAPVTPAPAPSPEPLTPAGGGIYVITPYGSGGP